MEAVIFRREGISSQRDIAESWCYFCCQTQDVDRNSIYLHYFYLFKLDHRVNRDTIVKQFFDRRICTGSLGSVSEVNINMFIYFMVTIIAKVLETMGFLHIGVNQNYLNSLK